MTSLLYLGYFQKDLLSALQQTEAYFPMESVIEKNSITKSHKISELVLAANYKQIEHGLDYAVLCSIQTKEWPAQGIEVVGDSSPALASIFDQVQLLKSKTCICFHIDQVNKT